MIPIHILQKLCKFLIWQYCTAEGRTPLHLAALGGHVGVLRFLLDKSVWPDAFDARDDSALHLAAR